MTNASSGKPKSASVPPSPFFHPSTPRLVVVQQTPRGSRRSVPAKDEVNESKSSILGCTANLMNAIVGAGIVGIPFAVQQAGFCAGIFLIGLVAVLTDISLRWLINTAKHVHVGSYETLAEAAFGIIGFRFVAANMFVMAYGAMLTYLMIVKDTFATLLLGVSNDEDTLTQKRAVLIAVSLFIMVPLSSQRDMADLAKTSRLSVLIDMIIVVLVVCNAPIRESLDSVGGLSALLRDVVHVDTIFVGLGVLSFAFVCQHSSFIIAGSLERPTVRRWSTVTGLSLTLCAVLAWICGVCGYAGYLDRTEGNILNNMGDGVIANIARALMGTAMLCVYPLESFVARHVCIAVFFSGQRAHDGDSDASILNRRDRRIGLTFVLYLLAVIPAAFVSDMGSVLALTGAVGGSCLSYIGPGLVFLGIHGGRFLDLVEKSWLGCLLQTTSQHTRTASMEVPDNMVETTPLVTSGRGGAGVTKNETVANAPHTNRYAVGEENGSIRDPWYLLRIAVWYICGFPLWCAVAKIGRKGLTRHVHDITLKSPHPIRIGNVEYSRVFLSEIERGATIPPLSHQLASFNSFPSVPEDSTATPTILAPTHKTKLVPAVLPSQPQDVNTRVSQNLVRTKRTKQTQLDAMEADPQENPPSECDFLLAIFFILFGCMALIVGILSLFGEKS